MRSIALSLPWIGLLTVACGPQKDRLAAAPAADSISPTDDPGNVIPGADVVLADNIGPGDVGQTFGVPDANVPYPDTYWPFTGDGIDAHWSGGPSPLEKYMGIADPANAQNAKTWEHNDHGSAVPNVSSWWGHCPGWTGAAMSNAPILAPVYAKADGQGGLMTCTSTDPACVRFEIGDVNALEAEIYVDGSASFAGARCDKKPSDIQRDANGRIVRDGSGCKGINAGSLLVLLGNLMRQGQQAMAIDAQNDFNTDQIWNQPAYRYTVDRYETLTASQAANLVAHGTRDGDQTTYSWNTAAAGFVFVDITIQWVSEEGPNTTVVSGLDSTRQTRFVAVIELDADPRDPNASPNVIGGEYLDDPSVGADRLTVPPFVWISNGPGPEPISPDQANTNTHNPYVRPSLVAQLVALGTQPPPGN